MVEVKSFIENEYKMNIKQLVVAFVVFWSFSVKSELVFIGNFTSFQHDIR